MHIENILIYQVPVKLKEPFIISLGQFTHAENIVIEINCSNGLKGFGECSPFKTIHGESMETCYIVASYLARVLIGLNPLAIQDAVIRMDTTIYGNNCIKSAFDMALYDIASQHAAQPLYQFLGGQLNKQLFTDYTISYDKIEKMVSDAIIIKQKGFKIIKVKLGGSKNMDIARIKAIRKAIGYDIPLRIDANQGWQAEDVIEILNDLKDENIQHCEEPIARWNYMELPAISRASPVKIMADESCCDPHDAYRLIQLKAVDLFNIKLSKAGGIFKALQIIKMAAEANIYMQLGGFLESRLGFTTAAHLAFSNEHIIYYDFDTPLMFEEDLVTGGITYSKGGLIEMPVSIGSGASIDEKYLRLLTHKNIR